jgi:hypothetical protein
MKKTLESDDFVIYDEVLANEDFARINNSAQSEEFSIPHIEKWLKVWRISDGLPMGGKMYRYNATDELKQNSYMDFMAHYFKELAKHNENICGEWDELVLRCYLYGRDTKLSWHNDKGYVSAGLFYCHNYWASTWGGELMIAKTPTLTNDSVPNPCINHTFEDKFLEHYGYGQYITCKPNRLVLTKGGVWHAINRVDKDAGDNVRMTVVAFYIKK